MQLKDPALSTKIFIKKMTDRPFFQRLDSQKQPLVEGNDKEHVDDSNIPIDQFSEFKPRKIEIEQKDNIKKKNLGTYFHNKATKEEKKLENERLAIHRDFEDNIGNCDKKSLPLAKKLQKEVTRSLRCHKGLSYSTFENNKNKFITDLQISKDQKFLYAFSNAENTIQKYKISTKEALENDDEDDLQFIKEFASCHVVEADRPIKDESNVHSENNNQKSPEKDKDSLTATKTMKTSINNCSATAISMHYLFTGDLFGNIKQF